MFGSKLLNKPSSAGSGTRSLTAWWFLGLSVCVILASLGLRSRQQQLLSASAVGSGGSSGSTEGGNVGGSGSAMSSSGGLLTVRQMKERMKLPCNYVHDGYYIAQSNEVLNQVYQSLMELDDDVIPVLIEVGGHDGITKSLSLKASICLEMNTLLIEASPTTYRVLQQTRGNHDMTVNAALCEGESVQLVENEVNSGQTHVATGRQQQQGTVTVQCTTIDTEIDKLQARLPVDQRGKLRLVFLVLDVEGHEPTAVDGIRKHVPLKAMIETKMLNKQSKSKIKGWAEKYNLHGKMCGRFDKCYNFHPLIEDKPSHLKSLLYGARKGLPKHTFKTSEASKSYMYYGE